jgi:hypothetical protein
MQPNYLNDSSSMSYVAPVSLDIPQQRTRSFSELMGMPSSPMPLDFSSMSTYGAMPQTNFGLDYSGGPSGTGFNFGSMGGTGFPANGATIATPGLTGGIGNGTQPGGMFSGIGQWMRDSGFLGSRDANGVQTQGWGGLALGGAQALGSLYMGMKQYGLAKDTLAANKAQFERNFDAQRTTTNASLEDRQRARVASNAGAYQSVGDYMDQNRVR